MLSNLGYRTSRQFILLLIPFVLIGILLLFGFYQLLPEPTCFDNVKNQNEEDIDCGGNCINCLFKNIQKIEVSKVFLNEVNEQVYDVAALVQNPNTKLNAKEFAYEFVLKDDKGVIMLRKRGISYLYAGETAYILESNLLSKRSIASVEFSIFNDKVIWVLGDYNPPRFVSGEKKVEFESKPDGSTLTKLEITMFNESLNDYNNIEIAVFIKDEQKKEVIAMNKTFVNSLKAGSSVPLIFTWPKKININLSGILLEPRINLIR